MYEPKVPQEYTGEIDAKKILESVKKKKEEYMVNSVTEITFQTFKPIVMTSWYSTRSTHARGD